MRPGFPHLQKRRGVLFQKQKTDRIASERMKGEDNLRHIARNIWRTRTFAVCWNANEYSSDSKLTRAAGGMVPRRPPIHTYTRTRLSGFGTGAKAASLHGCADTPARSLSRYIRDQCIIKHSTCAIPAVCVTLVRCRAGAHSCLRLISREAAVPAFYQRAFD